MRSRFQFGKEIGPPPTERFVVCLLLAVVLAIVIGSQVLGGEPDARPTVWIYTWPAGCPNCEVLKREVKKKKALVGFNVVWLDGTGYEAPTLYYRDARGAWAHYSGWSAGNNVAFMAEWKAATRR